MMDDLRNAKVILLGVTDKILIVVPQNVMDALTRAGKIEECKRLLGEVAKIIQEVV